MYWCFCCYGRNLCGSGRCQHCGGEIAAPEGTSFEDRLMWTLGHPDGDRAVLAARTLGKRRIERARPRLLQLVTAGTDPFLAAEALRTLLEIGDVAALRPLLEDLASDGPFMLADIASRALKQSASGRSSR